jgi:F-box-like
VAIVKIECAVSLLPCVAYARHAKMSLFSCHQPHQLSDDVLLAIFNQLDEQDQLRCETVCRQWRNFLISGTPWRRLFQRKIVSSQQWRNIVRIFGVDVEKLKTVHYRSLCRAIIEEQKQIDRNWRSGKFKKTSPTYPFGSVLDITVWGDHIAACSFVGVEMTCNLVHRTSLEVISSVKIPRESVAVTNTEIVVQWDKKNMKILHFSGRLISEVPELDVDERLTWELTSCFLLRDQVAVLSQTDEQLKLSLWDVSDPLTRLKSQRVSLDPLSVFNVSMKMDEQFVVVSVFRMTATTFFFFSKKTLNLHWEKTFDENMRKDFAYGKGLLLIYVSKRKNESGKWAIQIYDVTSKTYLREVRITVKSEEHEELGRNTW